MITVYLKPTNFCNVGCSHCYLPEEVRANKYKMSMEKIKEISIFLKEMLSKTHHDLVHICWHGGEPMILPANYFDEANKIINEIIPNNIQSIQTSLIPFKEEFIPIVKKYFASEIGTSLDFSSRTIKGSQEDYLNLWMKKVDLARKNDLIVIPGITPSKLEIKNARKIMDYCLNNDFYVFNIERYNEYGMKHSLYPSNKEHSLFLIDLFNYIFEKAKNNEPVPFIRVIAAAINGVLNEMPGDRWGGSCQSDFLVIEPDGSINNCPDKASFEKPFSNINDGYDNLVKSPERKKWIRIQVAGHRINDCQTCENNTWCKSGCPINENKGHNNNNEEECSGYKMFLDHIRIFVQDENNKKIVLQYLDKNLLPEHYKKYLNHTNDLPV